MLNYSKTCVKQPFSKRQKIGFQDQLSFNAGQKYCRMLQWEHSDWSDKQAGLQFCCSLEAKSDSLKRGPINNSCYVSVCVSFRQLVPLLSDYNQICVLVNLWLSFCQTKLQVVFLLTVVQCLSDPHSNLCFRKLWF